MYYIVDYRKHQTVNRGRAVGVGGVEWDGGCLDETKGLPSNLSIGLMSGTKLIEPSEKGGKRSIEVE